MNNKKKIQTLENKMELQINSLETRIETMQEMFNKDRFSLSLVKVAKRRCHLLSELE